MVCITGRAIAKYCMSWTCVNARCDGRGGGGSGDQATVGGLSREDKILEKGCGRTKPGLLGGMACAATFLLYHYEMMSRSVGPSVCNVQVVYRRQTEHLYVMHVLQSDQSTSCRVGGFVVDHRGWASNSERSTALGSLMPLKQSSALRDSGNCHQPEFQ